jgi:hypothetical protein
MRHRHFIELRPDLRVRSACWRAYALFVVMSFSFFLFYFYVGGASNS